MAIILTILLLAAVGVFAVLFISLRSRIHEMDIEIDMLEESIRYNNERIDEIKKVVETKKTK